jgi:hypothetical protein
MLLLLLLLLPLPLLLRTATIRCLARCADHLVVRVVEDLLLRAVAGERLRDGKCDCYALCTKSDTTVLSQLRIVLAVEHCSTSVAAKRLHQCKTLVLM